MIQTYLNDQTYFEFDINVEKQTNVFFRPGDIIDTNSKENVGKYMKIASTEKRDRPYKPGNNLGTFYVRLDSFQEYSEKTGYTLLELAAEVGGLSEFVFIIGLTLTEIFTGKLFISDMISKLYMVGKSTLGDAKERKVTNTVAPAVDTSLNLDKSLNLDRFAKNALFSH